MEGYRTRLRWALLTAAAVAAVAVNAVQADAANPDLVAASLQGPWNLVVKVASYTGTSAGGPRKPVGFQATDTVWFQPACQAPGTCAVRIWGPGGPDASQSFYTYYGQTSGFEGTVGTQALQQSGPTYTTDVPIGGFGGRLPCGLPSGKPRPAQHLSLTVTDAKPSGGGWLATALTGTEVLIDGWSCNGSQPGDWISKTLSITGHPVGYVASAAPPDRSTAVTVASIAGALNPPDKAFRSPALLIANLVVTALVILFVTFPSALFNHTLSVNYEEIAAFARRFGWLRRLFGAARERSAAALAGRRREAAIFGAVVAVGAWINGQLDPKFGFNGTSVLSYAATVLNICFGVAVSALIAMTYRRARKRDRVWRLNALPLGLLVAVACVLVSRITGFQPGYFYGLVVGVAFGASLERHEAGHTAALSALTTMGVAVVAWIAWAAVNPSAQRPGAGWPLVLLDDFLGSVFVGGLVGNVVGLLPLRSLAGGTLVVWRRAVWAVIFAVAVFGLVQVLLHPEQGKVHPSSAPLLTAILLFVGFAGGSLAFNRYFAWGGRPTRLPATAAPAMAAAPAGRG